ncbi:hypothetical protein AX761_24855 [Rhizobium sp. 58]|nr:hypothetical protein AX761_24855 [Rhizobium sp. 58]
MNGKNLGFGAKLTQIQPEAEPARDIPLEKEDAIAERHGFTSREPTIRVEKIRKKNQIQDTVYVRGPIDMTNRFKEFCNINGFSYGEGLEALMKKAGI